MNLKIHFSDFFNIDANIIENYGAFNISLINDLPLFIDPFLLFGSKKTEYQNEHQKMLNYLAFLKEKAEYGISASEIQAWYVFKEVKQNWFGYSRVGNSGSGLGMKFGNIFSSTIGKIFPELGNEKLTQTTHIEKACLFQIGVGKDNISDFATNLIKEFLLDYTEKFTISEIDESLTKKIKVERVYFDYSLERWMPKEYRLPFIFDDYVILTPIDILTKDENWINSSDLKGSFDRIVNSISNSQLRGEISNYFRKNLPIKEDNKKHTQKEKRIAIDKTIKEFPQVADQFVKLKEENKIGAVSYAKEKVDFVHDFFVEKVSFLADKLSETSFYKIPHTTAFEEAMKRLLFFKDVIEKHDGYKFFYKDGLPIKRESDLQLIYRLTWYASPYEVSREPNNGRGPVDYSISYGSRDKTIVEFKLASNSKLKQNLENQVEVYRKSNNVKKSITAILFFETSEQRKVMKILNDLNLKKDEEIIILIDASVKVSASNVKTIKT